MQCDLAGERDAEAGLPMRRQQYQVAEFHEAVGATIGDRAAPQFADVELRLDLLSEEFSELQTACTSRDLIGAIDALADIAYVIFGTAEAWGVDLGPMFDEVHRANMSKITEDGRVLRREDGKILKPSTYSPPDLERVLDDQVTFWRSAPGNKEDGEIA